MSVREPMKRIVKMSAEVRITIPAAFRRRLGIEANSSLHITLKDNRIQIIPLVGKTGEELREYSKVEIAEFLRKDQSDPDTARAITRLLGLAQI